MPVPLLGGPTPRVGRWGDPLGHRRGCTVFPAHFGIPMTDRPIHTEVEVKESVQRLEMRLAAR